MLTGNKYFGLGVDIWSCGVILYALICGYLPFEDENTTMLYKKIMNGEYIVPNFVSTEAKDLIKKILTTDPTKRITITEIRDHKFYNLLKVNRDLYSEEKVRKKKNICFFFFFPPFF